MSYTTRAKLVAKIPDAFLVEATDDDGDGAEDAGILDEVIASANEEVDSYLEGRYEVPVANPPALLVTAATAFACETIYQRRGYAADTEPKNPWSARAAKLRERLARVGEGKEALHSGTDQKGDSVVAVTEPARTHSKSGRLLA